MFKINFKNIMYIDMDKMFSVFNWILQKFVFLDQNQKLLGCSITQWNNGSNTDKKKSQRFGQHHHLKH